MKVYQTNEIKNVALLGSSGSGKTTLAECMLFEAGVIKRRGSVACRVRVWLFCFSNGYACGMESQKTQHYRLPG